MTNKQHITFEISDDSFVVAHSETLDALDVYCVLEAALAFIEDEAEAIYLRQGSGTLQ